MNKTHPPQTMDTASRRISRYAGIIACCVCFTCSLMPSRAEALQFVMQDNRIQVDPNQIVSWIFGNQLTAEQVRTELEEILQTRIDLIAHACYLNPEQQEKLRLAGAGDIHRFFNEFETLRRSLPTGSVTQQEYQDMWQQIQPFQQKYNAGLFSHDSLLNKTVRYVLEEDQVSRYEEFERQRQQRYYESVVRGTIAMMEDELPLTVFQREKLFRMVLSKNVTIRTHQNSYYQMYAVLYQISKIPQEELKPVFLENEWKIMQALLQNARGYEQMLRQQGLLD